MITILLQSLLDHEEKNRRGCNRGIRIVMIYP
jgi:hypothetical protein